MPALPSLLAWLLQIFKSQRKGDYKEGEPPKDSFQEALH